MDLRRLDALVAEKVMGLTSLPGVCAPRRGTIDDTWGRVLPDGYRERTPLYSSSIEAAWRVVKKMQEGGWVSSHTDLSLDSGQQWWSWHFSHHASIGGLAYSAQADSPMLAISVAALRALGVEVPTE
jgi:hypothetical protein